MRPHGLAAGFGTAGDLVAGARAVRAAGFRRVEAYSPFPVDELMEVLALPPARLGRWALAGGLLGAAGGFLLQWWINVVDYPLNIGGRALAAWPAFLLPSFELAILGGTIFVLGAMLAKNGLPRLHHPVFELRERADLDTRFLLVIDTAPGGAEPDAARACLAGLATLFVEEVPA